MTRLRENTQIVLSDLGVDAGLLGSASIVMENTFEKQIELARIRPTVSALAYSKAS